MAANVLPHDVVLDGFDLPGQHQVDHEFLLEGAPLSPWLPLVGLMLVAFGAVFLAFRKRGSSLLLIVGGLLTLHKLVAVPVKIWLIFGSIDVLWYSLKYYFLYWQLNAWVALVIGLAAILSGCVLLLKSR